MSRLHNNALHYTAIIVLSAVNLVFMHYYIGQYAEVPFDGTSYIDNLTGITFDITVLCGFLVFLFNHKFKQCLLAVFIITLIWAFSNILYCRFFFQYVSLSSIGQSKNLFDSLMIKCIIEGLQWKDMLLGLSLIMALWIYHYTQPVRLKKTTVLKFTTFILLLACSISIIGTIIYSFTNPNMRSIGYVKHHLYSHHLHLYRNTANPNWTHFQRGSLRTLFLPPISNLFTSKELTLEQQSIIREKMSNQSSKVSSHTIPEIENVIFIIIESYLSLTSDLYIDGKEITPNLNRLKHTKNVYYNGNLKSNITIGESGDGQFICMTGMLPLRSEITVGLAKNISLPGLPQILASKYKLTTRMLIPTKSSMWEQEQMCRQYGIRKLYSCIDFNNNNEDLNDKQIFESLITLDKKSPRPFFSLVLTMSMHQPYTEIVDPSFTISNPKLSQKYLNYLNACHYTDHQIGCYLKFLKDSGLYDRSLIIITSDHHPNNNSLEMNNLSENIPLYIVNGNINNNSWKGTCNQLDVYTTILDLLISDNMEWRGLGNTLLSPSYKNSLTTEAWDISEWILKSDFFGSNTLSQ